MTVGPANTETDSSTDSFYWQYAETRRLGVFQGPPEGAVRASAILTVIAATKTIFHQSKIRENDLLTYTVDALDDPVLRYGGPDTTIIIAYMGGHVLSYTEKAETLAANLQAKFQWMNKQSKPTVTEMVNEVM